MNLTWLWWLVWGLYAAWAIRSIFRNAKEIRRIKAEIEQGQRRIAALKVQIAHERFRCWEWDFLTDLLRSGI